MSANRRHEEAVFHAALEKPTRAARLAYLDEVCGDDAQLRGNVERLLELHADLDGFLESPPVECAWADDGGVASEGPGTIVGRYKLMQKIGEGGFGVVYRAKQQGPVHLDVALKVVKPGMDTRQVIARFEAERQAMAVMDHPCVAKVFDAGSTESGRPYFVMELVEGQPITDYCDEHRLTIRERLRLLDAVCEAIDHAHGRGVIHRDIKPSNVLVTVRDGTPVPKVIDFGIAKATQRSLEDETVVTRTGQFIGTPQYMSPEQANMSPLDVGPRSDIYSLGVLLYELLTGTTPFDADQLLSAGLDEMRRIMREVDPPRPSARIRSLEDAATEVASQRDTAPQTLHRLVVGDLDWITLKTLEKDPAARYATPRELADDIGRFLENRPIFAKRPSVAKRLSKWTQRHRAMTASGVLLLAVSVVLLAASNLYIRWQKAETEKQLRIATSMRLAAQSQGVRNETPIQSLLLAVEATMVTRRHGEGVHPLARESLLGALSVVGGRPLMGKDTPVAIPGPAFSPNGRWMVTSNEGEVRLWDLTKHWNSKVVLGGQKSTDVVWAVTSDGRWIVTSKSFEKSRELRLWDLTAEDRLTVLDGRTGWPQVSPDGRWLAAAGPGATVDVVDLTAEDPSVAVKVLRGDADEEQKIGPRAFSPDGRWLVTYSGYGTNRACLWDLAAEDPNETSIPLPMKQHEAKGLKAAFSPDGRWLATGSSVLGADPSTAMKLWDLRTGDPAEAPVELAGDPRQISSVAFSPDGRWLVSAGLDSTAQLWDMTTTDPAHTHIVLRGHTDAIWDAAFSPDNHWLVTGGSDRTARVWNLTAEDPSAASMVLRGHESRIMKAAFTPDSQWVMTWSSDGAARVWNIWPGVYGLTATDGLANKTFALPTTPRLLWQQPKVKRVWTIKDGGKLFTANDRGEGMLWDAPSSDPWDAAIRFSASEVTGAETSSGRPWPSGDGRWVWYVGNEGTVVWDLHAPDPASSGRVLPMRRGQDRGQLRITGNGRWMFITSFGDLVPVPGWPLLATSPDGRWLAAPNWDCSITLWDLRADDSARHPLILCGENRGPPPKFNDLRVWDLQAPDPAASSRVLSGHQGDVTWVVFRPDSRCLAIASKDRTIRLWDVRAEETAARPHGLLQITEPVEELKFSSDGKWLIAQSQSKDAPCVHLWDLSDRDVQRRPIHLPGETLPWQIPNTSPFSPDGRWLKTVREEGPVRLWDLTADDPSADPRVLRGHVGTALASAFSPDGRWLVTGGSTGSRDGSILTDETVRLWDLRSPDTGIGCVVLRGYASRCAAARFTADSHHLVTRCSDGEVRVWDLRLDELIQLARRAAGRELTPEEREEYVLP